MHYPAVPLLPLFLWMRYSGCSTSSSSSLSFLFNFISFFYSITLFFFFCVLSFFALCILLFLSSLYIFLLSLLLNHYWPSDFCGLHWKRTCTRSGRTHEIKSWSAIGPVSSQWLNKGEKLIHLLPPPGSFLSHLDYGSRDHTFFLHLHCGYYSLNGSSALPSFISWLLPFHCGQVNPDEDEGDHQVLLPQSVL